MKKKVYLTIDDSPTKDFKDKFSYLKDKGIPAVFFCIGEEILRYQTDIIDAIQMGACIGNHSFKHRYFSDMTYKECVRSIKVTDEIIDDMYKKANKQRKIKVFRFPHFDQGGDESSKAYESKWIKPQHEWTIYKNEAKRAKLQHYLRTLGYKQPNFEGLNFKYFHDKKILDYVDVRCTFDQMEYFLGDDSAPYGLSEENMILHRIDEDVPTMGRSLNRLDTTDIILIHDQEKTTNLFYRIIDKYLSKGIEFLEVKY